MTKYEGHFTEQSPREVVNVFLQLGLTLRNPSNGYIGAFSRSGEEVPIQDERDAIKFLLDGNGVSFWVGPNHDVFVSSNYQGRLVASFDGHTMDEQDSLVRRFREAGLAVEIRHEEEDPP